MDVVKALKVRKSIRSYNGEPLTKEQMDAILFAAEASPVGMGKYDLYQLTVVTDAALLGKIDANAAEFFGNPDMHPLYGAPSLIVVSGPEEGNVPSGNAAMIVHSMALQAVELGVGHCDIYGAIAALNQKPELVAELKLPEGFKPIAAIALGQTDDSYEEREIDTNRIKVAYI